MPPIAQFGALTNVAKVTDIAAPITSAANTVADVATSVVAVVSSAVPSLVSFVLTREQAIVRRCRG